MSKQADAFITEVDIPQRKDKSALLDPVRKEHSKIREVVEAFSNKVEKLVDKQRNEYILAYENHMQDVQRELHQLREKVADIANDETKNEKTEKLKADQKRYKSEALKLEVDTDEIRKKIRKVVRQIYSVEKTRDWMLKRLRQAKKKYSELLKERARVYEDWDAMSMSLASMSNGSSYTVEMGQYSLSGGSRTKPKQSRSQSNKLSNPHTRMNVLFNVDRDRLLPQIGQFSQNNPSRLVNHGPSGTVGKNGGIPRGESLPALREAPISKSKYAPPRMVKSKSGPVLRASFCNAVLMSSTRDSFDTSAGAPATAASHTKTVSSGQQQQPSDPNISPELAMELAAVDSLSEEQAVARLVSLRTRQQELRRFLATCASSLHKAPWSRVKKRPMVELLAACEDKLHSTDRFRDEHLLQLVCELASMPETYSALLDVLDNYQPPPSNFKSDEEISAAQVVRPRLVAGSDPVADELLLQYSSQDQSQVLLSPPPHAPSPHGLGHSFSPAKTHSGSMGGMGGSGDIVDDFRAQMDGILQRHEQGPREVSSSSGQGTAGSEGGAHQGADRDIQGDGGGLLDDDLRLYFQQEAATKDLSNLGFFQDDADFLQDFKLSSWEKQARRSKTMRSKKKGQTQ